MHQAPLGVFVNQVIDVVVVLLLIVADGRRYMVPFQYITWLSTCVCDPRQSGLVCLTCLLVCVQRPGLPFGLFTVGCSFFVWFMLQSLWMCLGPSLAVSRFNDLRGVCSNSTLTD